MGTSAAPMRLKKSLPLVTEGPKRTGCKQRTFLLGPLEPVFTIFSPLTDHEEK